MTDVLERLTGIVSATLKLPLTKVDPDVEMIRLGIDSIIAMELIDAIGREFAVSLAPAQFMDVATLRELAGLLHAPAPAATVATTAGSDVHALLSFVSRTYAIDPPTGRFDSVDALADALVAGHADELMRHYGMKPQPVPAQSATHGVALVGLSCRLPDAPDARTFWANLVAGRNSVREIPASRWRWQDHYADAPAPGKTVSKWGALLDDVDRFDAPFFGIAAAEADMMDPQQRLLLQEAWHAIEDAGIDPRSLAGSNTGVFVGYQYSEYEQRLRGLDFQRLNDGPVFTSSSPTYYLANRISFAFDLRGPSEAVNVNCASSAVALDRAFHALLNGECDMAIVAGVSLNLFAQDYIASTQYGLLSPDGTSGVFDNAARGFTRGEGVGVLVLERDTDVHRARRRVYASIRGCHQNYRGAARSLSEVRHESITDVLATCYRRAAVEPESVRYIEVDGYATKWADSFEFEGVKGALPAGAKRCALGNVKGNIGNVEAASGVVSVIKVALSLYHRRFPATLSMREISSFIDVGSDAHPLYIADHAIGFDAIRNGDAPVRAGVNSFADSGTNVHVLLEETPAASAAVPAAANVAPLFVLSARNPERLADYLACYVDWLRGDDAPGSFADLLYTAQNGRAVFVARLAVVAASRDELRDKLARVATTGLDAVGSLAAYGIHYAYPAASHANPLAGLIGEDIARMQLEQAMRTGQWDAVAQLWVNGVAMPWQTLWDASGARPVSLPGYPFARHRYWYDEGRSSVAAPIAGHGHASASGPPAPAAPSDDALPPTPSRAIERLLQREIGRHVRLPADAVRVDLGFIELGMNSIALAGMIEHIAVVLGVNLAPSTIFLHPRIDMLAAHLAQICPEAPRALDASAREAAADAAGANRTAEASYSAALAVRTQDHSNLLITVQPHGDAVPIFALPGAGGSVLSLHRLSHAFGAGQPFHCIEAVGLDGLTPPMSQLETMARLNIGLLTALQSNKPYRLLGYSNGGVVAFEMARQLAALGETVSSLVLLDTLCPTLRDDDMCEMTAAVFRNFVKSLGAHTDLGADRLRQIPEPARSAWLYDTIVALGLDVPRAQFIATFDVATASERACQSYAPQVLPDGIDVLLVRARDGFAGAPADYGWGEFCRGALRIREVAGDHFTLLEAQQADALARLIDAREPEPANPPMPDTEPAVSK
ncbi:beta-ketoacyl synthase N-terminal-like domain-containing protein [Paraburkholderia humisilvae]|uniref:Carrier domain-containing protein n=1 Tax=Paraburkholderia humisilvae TaxID=627669 RepID=A0A6J5EH41_9BURK|nr:beta-ketoacyl synthase N-terminal-like domain-containing protein [Paraburkholderia humisilvae]CAB3765858.1 hypothetical protein LMG29542_05249 [Paraburkholderia humisilvae]